VGKNRNKGGNKGSNKPKGNNVGYMHDNVLVPAITAPTKPDSNVSVENLPEKDITVITPTGEENYSLSTTKIIVDKVPNKTNSRTTKGKKVAPKKRTRPVVKEKIIIPQIKKIDLAGIIRKARFQINGVELYLNGGRKVTVFEDAAGNFVIDTKKVLTPTESFANFKPSKIELIEKWGVKVASCRFSISKDAMCALGFAFDELINLGLLPTKEIDLVNKKAKPNKDSKGEDVKP